MGDGSGTADIERIIISDHVDCKPGDLDGYVERAEKLLHFGFGAGKSDAIADQKHWTFGFVELVYRRGYSFSEVRTGRCFELCGIKTTQGRGIVERCGLDIERNVDPDRTGASVKCEIERLLHVIADVGGFEDCDGVFGQRRYDRNDVDLLHAYLANAHRRAIGVEHAIRAFDLTRDEEGGGGVEPCTGEPGDCVRAAWAGCQQGKAEMVGRLRIILGADGARLLMKITDGNDGGPSQSFVEMHCAAADDEEGVLDAIIGKKLYDVIGKFHYDIYRNAEAVRLEAFEAGISPKNRMCG